MKTRIYFILIIFFTSAIFSFSQAQEQLNQVDSKGRKQGHWIKKYDDGSVQYDGFFKDDKPMGLFKRYNPDKSLKAEMWYFENGITHAKLYYDNGKLAGEGKYINMKKDSIWNFYSYYSESLVSKETFANDLKNGESFTYLNNGNVSDKQVWADGKKNGAWLSYYESGKPNVEAGYKDNKLDGLIIMYYPSGAIQTTGFFKNGLKESKWIFYDDTGKKTSELNFKNGLPENQNQVDSSFVKEFEDNLKKAQFIEDPEKTGNSPKTE